MTENDYLKLGFSLVNQEGVQHVLMLNSKNKNKMGFFIVQRITYKKLIHGNDEFRADNENDKAEYLSNQIIDRYLSKKIIFGSTLVGRIDNYLF